MLDLSKYIHTSTGRTIISILLGIGCASLFRDMCIGKNCLIEVGPSQAELDGIYRWSGQCYNLKPEAVQCEHGKGAKSILQFSHPDLLVQ